MKYKPATPDAYRLLHEGTIALAQVEANGMPIDMDYLEKAITDAEERVRSIRSELVETEIGKRWKRKFGHKMKWGAKQQLASIVFDDMGYERKEGLITEQGDDKNDQSAFENVDRDDVRLYFQMAKIEKAKTTYMLGIKRATVDGILHTNFNLNLADSMRSSADDPNVQNWPVRDPEQGELVRRCCRPHDEDYEIGEVDYSGIEVHGATWYHKDPTMMAYLEDPTKDMHRDMAAQCFMLKPEQVDKQARYLGKNKFVFPQFYGDFWWACANALWEPTGKLDTKTGKPLVTIVGSKRSVREHLASKGIKTLGDMKRRDTGEPARGTFQAHIKGVEKDFWNNRFGVYGKWKREWYDRYVRNGGFQTLTGFSYFGVLRRNQVINFPVQGSAFHCLLWSLVRIQKWLNKYKMKSKIICQIHDSIVFLLHRKERDAVLRKAKQVMTDDILRHWSFINTPVGVEAEVAPPGGTWHEKKKYDYASAA
jgi:DNA polymerase I-like protein with 3'-5' exonuclease and polymerase domains